MEHLNTEEGKQPEDDIYPCQYFDLICGTSTGGLNALMLGRLGMVSTLVLRLVSLSN